MLRPVSRLVQDFVVAYANQDEDYIAHLALPPFPVGTESTGKFSRMPKRNFYGDNADATSLRRAPKAGSNILKGTSYETVDYKVDPYNAANLIDNFDALTADVGVELRKAELKQAVDNLKIDREKRAAAVFFSSSFTNTAASSAPGSIPYSDPTLGTPINDMLDIISDVRRACGKRPNGCIIGENVANALRVHEQVLTNQSMSMDRSLFTEDELAQWLARKLNLRKVFIGRAQLNGAAEGATVDLDDIWGNEIWIGCLSEDASGLGMRRAPGVFNADGLAVVRPVISDFEPYEQIVSRHQVEVGVDLAEGITLVSADHGKRITAA